VDISANFFPNRRLAGTSRKFSRFAQPPRGLMNGSHPGLQKAGGGTGLPSAMGRAGRAWRDSGRRSKAGGGVRPPPRLRYPPLTGFRVREYEIAGVLKIPGVRRRSPFATRPVANRDAKTSGNGLKCGVLRHRTVAPENNARFFRNFS
jgi:hypothetical protein